jgi:predicted alpha/beta superfamily hydrolase
MEDARIARGAIKSDFLGDEYLKFIVKELKPYIDENYRTEKDKDDTAICGSSMGGLISLYAICEYPEVFGKAACISTHWPVLFNNDNMGPSQAIRNYLTNNLPKPSQHKIYFDYGTETLDQYYEVHQKKVDSILTLKKYKKGKNWETKKFQGAAHNEKSWQERFDGVLKFLFKK